MRTQTDCGILRQESYKEMVCKKAKSFSSERKINYLAPKSPVIAAFLTLTNFFLPRNWLILCPIAILPMLVSKRFFSNRFRFHAKFTFLPLHQGCKSRLHQSHCNGREKHLCNLTAVREKGYKLFSSCMSLYKVTINYQARYGTNHNLVHHR